MEWIPAFSKEGFDQRMENAYRRVAGIVGHEMTVDRSGVNRITRTASNTISAVAGSDGSREHLFVRMGKGAAEAASFRPQGGIDLRDCAGEILREFFEEGKAAFHAAQAALHADAGSHLEKLPFDGATRIGILSSADSSFAMPDKDAFSTAAKDLCNEPFAPLTLAAMGGAAVFLPVVMVFRSPVAAGIGGLLATGFAYYAARNNRLARAEKLVNVLPKRLYDTLDAALHSNVRRYADTVNAAIAAKGGS